MAKSNKKCVLSLKKQMMEVVELEDDDVVLESSALAQIDHLIEESNSKVAVKKSEGTIISDSSSSSSDSSTDSESESDDDCESAAGRQSTTKMDAVPESETAPSASPLHVATISEDAVAVEVEETAGPSEPQPGPSNYEDISFEPAVTSTPRREGEDSADEEQLDTIEIQNIKKEMRDGNMLINQVEFEFVSEIRKSLQTHSTKYLSKLRDRRVSVSKRMALLKKQKRNIDNLLTLLNSQRDEIDDAAHKLSYFIEHFPYK